MNSPKLCIVSHKKLFFSKGSYFIMLLVVCRLNFLKQLPAWTSWERIPSPCFPLTWNSSWTRQLPPTHFLKTTFLAGRIRLIFCVSIALAFQKAEVQCSASVVLSNVSKSQTCSMKVFWVTVCFHGQLLFSYYLTSSSDPLSDTCLFSRMLINRTF